MRQFLFALSLAAETPGAAAAAPIVFQTRSTATQTLVSPLFGGTPTDPVQVTITARGPRTFALDPATGFADVKSAFVGADFPDPVFGTASYDTTWSRWY